jgi:hypothetical protein
MSTACKKQIGGPYLAFFRLLNVHMNLCHIVSLASGKPVLVGAVILLCACSPLYKSAAAASCMDGQIHRMLPRANDSQDAVGN